MVVFLKNNHFNRLVVSAFVGPFFWELGEQTGGIFIGKGKECHYSLLIDYFSLPYYW